MDRGPSRAARCRGCLLASAAGDALGAALEFARSDKELAALSGGAPGVRDYLPAYGRRGAITDDTQMTIATAEGLLAAAAMGASGDAVVEAVYRAYLGWLSSQAHPANRRGPGHTCLSALGSGLRGTPQRPINGSKGSGGVMRVAPVGLFHPGDPDAAFALGVATAALTHGHPGGYLPAGFLAALVARLVAGEDLQGAVERELERPALLVDGGEVRALLGRAVHLAATRPTPEAREAFVALDAEGWTGDEGLAIALFCALSTPDSLEEALVRSTYHVGDSDTTGAVTGAILGAWLGETAVPARWREPLEARDRLLELGDRLAELPGRFRPD